LTGRQSNLKGSFVGGALEQKTITYPHYGQFKKKKEMRVREAAGFYRVQVKG
jgi:hypothetical protein